MKVIQVTTAYARHDDEHEFDDLDELVDITGYDLDDESNEVELLRVAEEDDATLYVYQDPRAMALRWTRKRAKAVEAILEEGDEEDDDADDDNDYDKEED